MDLYRVIGELRKELDRLNLVIASLEEFTATGGVPAPSRRGRKSMTEEERRIVSQRMKRYWEQRRKPTT